jgi:sec-independent protein translocase protein TatA
MPFGMGMGEIMVILVIVLLLFGAKRIPEIAGALGKGINQFKRNVSDAEKTVRDADSSYRSEISRPEAPSRIDEPAAEPKRLI